MGDLVVYLGRWGQQYGPYAWEDVLRFARDGQLLADDLVWISSTPEWTPATWFPDLAPFLVPPPDAVAAPSSPAVPPRGRSLWPLLVLAMLLALGALVAGTIYWFAAPPPFAVVDRSSFTVVPSSAEQELRYSDRVSVVLPPGFATTERTLRIGRLDRTPPFAPQSPGVLALLDLGLDDGAQPPKPVELRLTYDPSELDPDHAPGEQLAAYRWDPDGRGWIGLPMKVDETSRTATVLVDHFSVVGVFRLLGRVLGVGGTAAYVATSVGEWALNDVYVTPQGNFEILYSASGIQASVLNDATWGQLYPNPGFAFRSQYPRYVQDMGQLLESALAAYTSTLGFRNPAGQREGWTGTYQKRVIVKLDSYFAAVTGAPSYEKIFERLHIPTNNAMRPDDARVTLGHELFHVVQAEYYGLAGMTNPMNSWWLEATADYAAHRAAWPTPVAGLDYGCGPNYLGFPISTKGAISGPGWSDRGYEYVTGGWVGFLVDRGFSFREMFEAVAGDHALTPPVRSLANYLGSRGGMETLYRQFAGWMMFSPGGFLSRYPLASFSGATDRDVASARSTLALRSGLEVGHRFELPVGYAAQLWTIRLDKAARQKAGLREPFLVTVKEKSSGVVVDIYLVPAGQRTLTPVAPLRSLFTEDSSTLIKAGAGDMVCVVAANGNTSAGVAEVSIADTAVLLEIDPPELRAASAGERYEFKLKAAKIPKVVGRVSFDWDFGDAGDDSSGSEEEAVADGEAETEISHTFEASDEEQRFVLEVVLKDERGVALTDAEAEITLPLGQPEVVIQPRRAVGPAGATFDFTAEARPSGSYRFEWRWPGLSAPVVSSGESSTVAPVFSSPGEQPVTVELYDESGALVATDRATAAVEEIQRGGAGTWYLVRQWSELFTTAADTGFPGPVTASISDGSGRTSHTFDRSDYEKYYDIPVTRGEFSHSWSALPKRMEVGREYTVTLSVADAGSVLDPDGSTSLWIYTYPFTFQRQDYALTEGGDDVTIRRDLVWPSARKDFVIRPPVPQTFETLFGGTRNSELARSFDPGRQEMVIVVRIGTAPYAFATMSYLYSLDPTAGSTAP